MVERFDHDVVGENVEFLLGLAVDVGVIRCTEDVSQAGAPHLVGDHFGRERQIVEDAGELAGRLWGVTLLLLDDEALDRDDRDVSVLNHRPPPGNGAAIGNHARIASKTITDNSARIWRRSRATRVTAAPKRIADDVARARLVENQGHDVIPAPRTPAERRLGRSQRFVGSTDGFLQRVEHWRLTRSPRSAAAATGKLRRQSDSSAPLTTTPVNVEPVVPVKRTG